MNKCATSNICWYESCWRQITSTGDASGLAQYAHYVNMEAISTYTFHIVLTGVQPKD